jgi:ElaB/YqjD/DUF883 family membrane-anchored ribosome-binding protein
MSNETGHATAPDLAAALAALQADIARLSDTLAALMRGQADAAGAALERAVGALETKRRVMRRTARSAPPRISNAGSKEIL